MPNSTTIFVSSNNSTDSMHLKLTHKGKVYISIFKINMLASIVHSSLPRSTVITSRLRSSQTFPKVYIRTKRNCSFIQYGLNHYQQLLYCCLYLPVDFSFITIISITLYHVMTILIIHF